VGDGKDSGHEAGEIVWRDRLAADEDSLAVLDEVGLRSLADTVPGGGQHRRHHRLNAALAVGASD
jgi:hypothetical protein